MHQGLNRVTLIGRLAGDPETRRAPSGVVVATFVLTVPRSWTGPEGQPQSAIDSFNVVAWGEFGRTPMINKDGGRDHWPRVGGALLAGGGLRTGQVIGATDRLGGEIADRGVHFGAVGAEAMACISRSTAARAGRALSLRRKAIEMLR